MRSVRHKVRFALIAACLLSAGCASLQQASSGGRSLLEQQQAQINPVKSQQDTVADASYDLMVAEIALNQGDTGLAIKHYLA
ncbi:MAG: hypothetical protein OEN02_18365, partial [Gammaproteobacteria bacterium]|nr:hypothetical protein [Gammaproteobacteria bacterium]